MFLRITPLTLIASTPFWAGPSSPLAFLPSRIVLRGLLFVPMIVRPSKFFFLLVPSRTTPSTYLPGLTLTIALTFLFFFLSLKPPAALTAFWTVRYLQPCRQTSKTFDFGAFFLPFFE